MIRLPALFVFFVLPTVLWLAMFVPVGQVPDETAHALRANSLLHGQILGHRGTVVVSPDETVQGAGVIANPALKPASEAFNAAARGPGKYMTPAVLDRLEAVPWSDTLEFMYIPNTALYLPLFYAPASVGMGLGHLAGLGPYDAILAARVVAALGYVALGTAALLIARRGRVVLFSVLSLPMSLYLAASCNHDGMLIAACALAVALLTRQNGRAYWSAGLILAAVIATKPPYIALSVAMLVAAPRVPMRQRAAGLLLTVLPALLWTGIVQYAVATPFLAVPYHPGPLWAGDPAPLLHWTDPAGQLAILRQHPGLLLRLPFDALGEWTIENGKQYEMVGIFGPLDLPIWPSTYTLWFAALGCALLGDTCAGRDELPGPSPAASLALAAGIAACAWTIYVVAYVSFTPLGADHIEGIQGRYALPLLAFLALAVPIIRFRGGAALRPVLALPPVAAAALGLVALPMVIVAAYYLH